ncbi:MAG TPA: DUF4292 domain-containing protein [Bacteroidales bacterium]|nr:DUF4292 domain-containing protein [Bacteroidales bacterium]
MRKIVVLILVVAVLSGCSGIKRAGKTGKGSDIRGEVSLEDVRDQNLSNGNFYIQKAEIDFESGNSSVSFIANIRHIVPDKYLISLRMRTGIEVGRIYIDRDTILANDRINKILYYGKSSVLSAKYGIPFDLIPALFGDFVGDPESIARIPECIEGMSTVNSYLRGVRLVYGIDCGNKKAVSLMQEGYSGTSGQIIYGNFEKNGGRLSPSEITLNHKESGSILNIKFERIETDWNGTIEFVPGNRYDRVELR